MKKQDKIIHILGIPSDFGANMDGALMGPDAMRTAGLHQQINQLGITTQDAGNIAIPIKYSLSEEKKNFNYLSTIVDINQNIKNEVFNILNQGHFPLCLGGDHSLSIGSLAGVCQKYANKNIGLLWIDTHADLNTPESSDSKNIHGMPISVLLGKGYPQLTQLMANQSCIKEENIVIIGLRDIDPKEQTLLKNSKINYFTMRDIDELGIQKIMKKVQKEVLNTLDGVHVSFDLDVMDPIQVPGVSTPVPGGLSLREAHLLLEMIYENNIIVSADFVELNPFNDYKGQSARMAVALITSLLGKRII